MLSRGAILTAFFLFVPAVSAQTITVDAKANIYSAGLTAAWNGALPAVTSFSAAPGRVVTFRSVTGTVNCRAGVSAGPDGSAACAAGTNLTKWGALSGIRHATRAMFLVGVFLDDTAPTGWGPPAADYSTDSFASTAPLIGQTFFIGDGLTGTGTGAQQQFLVPYGATRLFLGFAKSATFTGGPGDYPTGSGSLTAVLEISAGTSAGTSPLQVDGRSYLMRAGHPAMTGALPPPFVRFSAAAGRMITFSGVTGTVQWGGGTADPDGNIGSGLDVASTQGIAGIVAKYSTAFLAGVFLDDTEPKDPAPERLTFNQPFDFATVGPKVGQIFYIGDGLTGKGTGQRQQFQVPATATRLYLGLVWQRSWASTEPVPTWEATGGYTAAFELSTAPPVNCTYALGATTYSVAAAGGSSTVAVTTQTGCTWTAASNASWITVGSGASGSGNGTVAFSAAANASTSSRTGTLTIAGQTFTVTQAGTAPVCTYSISAASAAVAAAGSTGSVAVTAPSGCAWSAVSSGSWVTITAGASGSGNGTVQYTVAANAATVSRDVILTIAGLRYTVSQAGATAEVPADAPVISPDGIVNTADFTPNFAPGSIISIYGKNLASGLAVSLAPPLPVTLEGTSVEATYNNRTVSIPLFFVSSGQVNAQLPFDVPLAVIQLRVRAAKGLSAAAEISIGARNPRLFTVPSGGRGPAALLHSNYDLVSETSPARPGEWLVVYLTGLGAVSPAVDAGKAAGDGAALGPLNAVNERVEVTVNGQAANVYFAGLAPKYAGLYQINFQVPEKAGTGTLPLTVRAGGQESQVTTYFACRTAWTPAAPATVGPSGGTVSSGRVSLTFAPGALATETAIQLLQSPAGTARSPGQIDELYAVAGLPTTLNGPVVFSMDISGLTLPEGDAYLFFQPRGEGTDPGYYKATVSGNRLTATLGRSGAGGVSSLDGQLAIAGKESPGTLEDSGILGVASPLRVVGELRERPSPRNNFVILTPYRVATDAIGLALEEVLDSLRSMGVSTAGKTPIKVWLSDMPSGYSKVTYTSAHDEKTGQLVRTAGLMIDPDILLSAEQIKPRVARGLMRLVTQWFDPRPEPERLGRWLWMDEAVAAWFERRAGGPSYVPDGIYENHSAVPAWLQGLELADDTALNERFALAHGVGAAQFLEQLADGFPDGKWFVNLYNLKKAPSGSGAKVDSLYSPVQALQQIVPNLAEVWKQFCERYTQGKIYANAGYTYNVVQTTGARLTGFETRLFRSTDDVFRYHTWAAPDLSARYYTVGFANDWKEKNATLRFRLTATGRGGAWAVLYKWNLDGSTGPKVAEVGANAYIDVENAPSLVPASTSRGFLIVVINGRAVAPYDETSVVTLQVELKGRIGVAGEFAGGLDPALKDAALARMLAKGLSATFESGDISLRVNPDNSITVDPNVRFTGSYKDKDTGKNEYTRVTNYTLHDARLTGTRVDGKYTASGYREWLGTRTDFTGYRGDWHAEKQNDGSYLLFLPNGEPPTWGDIAYRLR